MIVETASHVPLATVRPLLSGARAAVSAADARAVAAGTSAIEQGGNAVDAAIAAQAVLCVVAPEACGLGGDAMVLVARPGEPVVAVNGAGASAMGAPGNGPGATVTVPGIVGAWAEMAVRFGRLPLAECLRSAITLAADGCPLSHATAAAVIAQRDRLDAGGAAAWVVATAAPGERALQPALAATLRSIGEGRGDFYTGPTGEAIVSAVSRTGGSLTCADLAAHRTGCGAPLSVPFGPAVVHVQPPMSQGVLLAMALRWLHQEGLDATAVDTHTMIELLGAVFEHRDAVVEGELLLDLRLTVDRERATGRAGARSYLHTAGVAAADADGMVVSSLVSVFDDFGSCVYVPELGFVLNNRAEGFTVAPNDAAPAKRPVHTLAPVIVETPDGLLALATPGADGQVQTLLQVVVAVLAGGADLPTAIGRPRWRSQDGRLLIESGHPEIETLRAMGHGLDVRPDGEAVFGAVVAAGSRAGTPSATADWRRSVWAGAL